jgi:putative ABC transport system ATP-binding protein
MDHIIRAESVSKIYQAGSMSVKAVDNFSFDLKPGEFMALVGPSGSGKTTMLAVLAALLTPTGGRVLIDEQDLSRMKENERVRFRRERIGFTFQANNLVPYLSVRENVELMLRLNHQLDKSGRELSEKLLERLGLTDKLENLPSQLSGGQRQRVAIAR